MKANKMAVMRRRMLEPVAESLDVDYDLVSLYGHGQSEANLDRAGVAFGLLGCGADLLIPKTRYDEFPARGKTSKRGAKLLARALGSTATVWAASVLAQAQAMVMADLQGRDGSAQDAAWHRKGGLLVQSYFPVPDDVLADLEERRIEARQWAAEVERRRTEVEDPDFDHPDIEVGSDHGRQRFQFSAMFCALDLALDGWATESLETMILATERSYDALTMIAADAADWLHVEAQRSRFVRAAVDQGHMA
jgi:hypothetical protein